MCIYVFIGMNQNIKKEERRIRNEGKKTGVRAWQGRQAEMSVLLPVRSSTGTFLTNNTHTNTHKERRIGTAGYTIGSDGMDGDGGESSSHRPHASLSSSPPHSSPLHHHYFSLIPLLEKSLPLWTRRSSPNDVPSLAGEYFKLDVHMQPSIPSSIPLTPHPISLTLSLPLLYSLR